MAFTPKVELGLVDILALGPSAWFRADSMLSLANGADVVSWPDASGNGNDLLVFGSPIPTYERNSISGRPSVVMTEPAVLVTYFPVPHVLSAAGHGTVYSVFQRSAGATATGTIWQVDGGVRSNFVPAAGASETQFFSRYHDAGGSDYAGKHGLTLGVWQSGLWLYGGGDGYCGRLDYDTAALGSIVTGAQASVGATTQLYIGSWRGRIAEVIIFREAHTEEQRRTVAQYLRAKYPVLAETTSAPAAQPWSDVSDDVVSDVSCSWGIHGWQPKDRVADPGAASFDLDNGTNNSNGPRGSYTTAGHRGYYTVGHPNVRAGFGTGTPVRVSVSEPFFGTRVLWVGTIDAADPSVTPKDPRTRVRCVDWMDDAARAKLSGLAVQTDVQSDAVFTAIVASLDKQPPGGTLVGAGSDVYPFALDNAQDESSKVIGEFQKLAMSEYALIYEEAGVLTFEGRRRRFGSTPTLYGFDEMSMVGLTLTNGRDDVLNRVQVTVHPRRVDSAPTVLFSLSNAVPIVRGTTVVISCPYRDQGQQAQRIGGTDMVTPVAGTDYSFRPNADGSGANLDAQLTITPVFGGNTAVLTITNNGPSDGYLPAGGLQLRGTGLYNFEPLITESLAQESIDGVGESPIGYDMPYQSSVETGYDVAYYILAQNKDARLRPKTVTWLANWDSELTQLFFSVGISTIVEITSEAHGLDAVPCYVNGFNVVLGRNGVVKITNDLAPVDTTAYWILEGDGSSELDNTTVLGYGLSVTGWILDESSLGVDAFLA
jgi:hypothetical protein